MSAIVFYEVEEDCNGNLQNKAFDLMQKLEIPSSAFDLCSSVVYFEFAAV
jgi:hypothetical protein